MDKEKKPVTTQTEVDIHSDFLLYLASDIYDLQKICRLCLAVKTDVQMTSLLSEMAYGKVADMLKCFTSIEVIPEEDLPCHICSECLTELIKCCEFKSKCERSDASLKSAFRGEYVVKDEELDEDEIIIEYEPINDGVVSTEDCSNVTSRDETIVLKRNKKTKENKSKSRCKIKKERCSSKNKKSIKCRVCSKSFPDLMLLRDHLSSEHNTKASGQGCPQCKEHFEIPKDLELHASVHEPGPLWNCIQCCKVFYSRKALRRHVLRHMQRKKHCCDRCGKEFSERYSLLRHCRVHTGQSSERQHLCVQCGKRFTDAARLREHMGSHSEQRPFACPAPACGKLFRSHRLLVSHSRVHDAARPYQCSHCEKRFRHESTWKAHERLHTGERPYVCAVCGKTFLQSSNLRLHARTHSGERPYACGECERSFKSSSSLKTHSRTHTGEKPYSCHICGKRFPRPDFRTHMLRHSGERPFPCAACPKRFFTAARLREHNFVVHSGEKPFECALCSHRVPTKSHMLKHIKSHQKKKQTTNMPKRKLLVVRVTDDTPYASIQGNPIILSNTDSCGEVIISDDCTDITNVASNDMTVSLANAVPLQMVENVEDNSTNFNEINNVNLVRVSEGEVSIAASSSLEGGSVKLYQLDQSLVQIHSSGGQVTISKITSKMTANFE